ncbi:hypothetical protein MMC08_006798 [Hypocenomyce scalaris]|nr:hypothetical protein [Hypocenomyce scalaris]
MTKQERHAALRAEPIPESTDARNALRHARRAAMRDQYAEKKAIIAARQAPILAYAPRFALSLTGPPTLSLSESTYPITATLTYTSDPSYPGSSSASSSTTPRPVLFSPTRSGPLSPSAANLGNLYSLYTDFTCTLESRIPHVGPNASMRPAREADGSFTREMVVESWEGWEELGVGKSVTREVNLGLDERSGWVEHLEKGKKYWVRCDEAGLGKLRLDKYWRYGQMADVELPFRVKIRDLEAVGLPLAPSNVIEFDVVD